MHRLMHKMQFKLPFFIVLTQKERLRDYTSVPLSKIFIFF